MLQLHGGLGLGLGLVLGFYSVRHLMNGWDLKYTFSKSIISYNFLCILLFLSITNSNSYISGTVCSILMGFQHNIVLTLKHSRKMKTELLFFPSLDSFC